MYGVWRRHGPTNDKSGAPAHSHSLPSFHLSHSPRHVADAPRGPSVLPYLERPSFPLLVADILILLSATTQRVPTEGRWSVYNASGQSHSISTRQSYKSESQGGCQENLTRGMKEYTHSDTHSSDIKSIK